MNEPLTNEQKTTLDKAAALLIVATVTIGVAGDKIAGLQDDLDVGELLASIQRHIEALDETANYLASLLREHGYEV